MRCHLLQNVLVVALICSSVVASGSPTCRIHIWSGKDGSAVGDVECEGGVVSMAFNSMLGVASNSSLRGVKLNKECKPSRCLVALCNATAMVKASTVSQVQLEDWLGERTNAGIICVQGRSDVTFIDLRVRDSYGSGVLVRNNSRALIHNSSFEGGTASGGAGVLTMGFSNVTITDSYFSSNTAMGYYGGGGLTAAEDSTVLLQRSLLTNNTVINTMSGGAIVVIDRAHMVISNSTISDNFAEGGGAGISVWYNATLLITDGTRVLRNNCTGNYMGGGVSASGDNAWVKITGKSIVEGNSALRNSGGGLSAMGQNVTMICTGDTLVSDNAADTGGGMYLTGSATFVMGDSEGNCTFRNNTAYFGPDVHGALGAYLHFNHTNIDRFSPGVFWSRTEPDCVMGETLQTLCQQCRPGTYSLNPKNQSCDICPVDGVNCPGGFRLVVLEGWWHSSSNSTQFHRCPHTDTVCMHGGGCANGYTGHLCGECAENYASNGPFHCVLCDGLDRAWAVYIFVSLLSIVLTAITAHATWRDNQDGNCDLKTSHMLHVVIMLVQYLLLISSIPLQWPATLGAVFRVSSTIFGVFGGQAAALDCILKSLNHITTIPLAILRQLATLLAPAVMFVAVLLAELIWWGLKTVIQQVLIPLLRSRTALKVSQGLGLHTKPQLAAKAPVIAMVVLSVSYPFLVRMSLGFFACIPLDDFNSPIDPYPEYAVANAPHGYWVSDMQQACWSGYHLRWALALGIPATAVFCVGIPAAILLWLLANTEALESDPGFRERYGLLYRNYRPKVFWFESVLRMLMSGVCAVSAFRYSLGSYYAILLMNGAFGAYCGLHAILKPYNSKLLSLMQLLAFACLYFITYLALTLFTIGIEAGPGYKQAAGIIALVCVVLYVAWCLYLMAKQSKALLLQLAGYIFPCFRQPKPKLPSNLVECVPTTKDAGQRR